MKGGGVGGSAFEFKSKSYNRLKQWGNARVRVPEVEQPSCSSPNNKKKLNAKNAGKDQASCCPPPLQINPRMHKTNMSPNGKKRQSVVGFIMVDDKPQ